MNLLPHAVLLEHLEKTLRAAATRGHLRIEGLSFQIFIAQQKEQTSFAVPIQPDPFDWQPALKFLQETFKRHDKRSSIEYYHQLHPSLKPALEGFGFQLDSTIPVMTLKHADLNKQTFEVPARYRRLRPDEPNDLKAFLKMQATAFGGDGNNLGLLTPLMQGMEKGAIFVAVLEQDKKIVSGASLLLAREAAELAGVATMAKKRRQGLASYVCQQLLTEYFNERYKLCWLSANTHALGLYERLGFRQIGEQMNYSLPE